MRSIAGRVVLALAAALVTAALGAGQALAVNVNLRVEGDDRTIFEGRVDTDGGSVNGRPCNGTNNRKNRDPGPTITSALDDAAKDGGFSWDGKWNEDFEDFFIQRIGPDSNDFDDERYWGYLLNWKDPGVGGCQKQVDEGDEVLFAYDLFGNTPLKLTAPGSVEAGKDFQVRVVDGSDGDGIGGAEVNGQKTNGDGHATLRFDSPQKVTLKAHRDDSIRSNSQTVCVHPPGSSTCDDVPGTAGTLAGPLTGPLVARITFPVFAVRYPAASAPRLLRGDVVSGGPPVTSLRIRLRRSAAGRCSHYSLVARRFRPTACIVPHFLYSIPPRPQWSYLLPTRLLPGTYALEAEALDAAGRRTRARRVFWVVAPARR